MKIKLKNYTHFSPKLERKDIPFILKYVKNPTNVVRHRFYPLIHYTIVEKKYKRLYDGSAKREFERTYKEKKREIYYSNHLDNQVYSYYGQIINSKLEDQYRVDLTLNNSVIGYRKIAITERRNKCNIDFAKEVFDFIQNSEFENTFVYCIDVSSFFDSLNHKILKQTWSKLFGDNSLPPDHYKVFRSVTQFTHVEIGDLITEFTELKIKKFKYLKNKKIKSFCKNGNEFRHRVENKNLIKFNTFLKESEGKRIKGIPQGLPISSTLSNLYMLEFDSIFSKLLEKYKGLYRRYSDDIIFACSQENAFEIEELINKYISKELKLEIQSNKTQIIHFHRNAEDRRLSYKSFENGIEINRPLSYLGFEFDGNKILVKQKSLSKYYRRIKRLIRRKAIFAYFAKKSNSWNIEKKDEWIYRQGIYKSKSHLGSKKKKVNGKLYRGNFISYIFTSSRILNQKTLKKQVRNHWKIIENLIAKYENKYSLPKTPSRRSKT